MKRTTCVINDVLFGSVRLGTKDTLLFHLLFLLTLFHDVEALLLGTLQRTRLLFLRESNQGSQYIALPCIIRPMSAPLARE